MGNKFILIFLLLIVMATAGKAQSNYQKTDSISAQLYNAAEWKTLISFGKKAIADGDDFLDLRLRVAYAAFVRGNFSEALVHYNHVLSNDGYNQIALYYAQLCNTYLNRTENASYFLFRLQNKIVEGKKEKPFALTAVGLESGLKFTDYMDRGNSIYARAFISLRASYKLSIDQSFSYFNQPVRSENIEQPGYYIRLNYTPIKNLSFIGSYHYMVSTYRSEKYQNHLGLLGAKYAFPHFDIQADALLSKIGEEKTKQFNLSSVNYLTGNLNLYSITKFSWLDTGDDKNLIFAQLIGIKAIKNLWFEAIGTFGKQYDFAEADGLYIYNGLDATKLKLASNCYFLLNQHLLFSLNYTFERKSDHFTDFNYLQHSINGGIKWNF